jgi:DNA polymerase III gamma/tau subunit
MRDALSILDQCSAYGDITPVNVSEALGGGDTQMLIELAGRISRYDEKGALEQLGALLDAGADTRTLIKDLADIFRRMMWLSAGAETEEQDEILKPMAKSFGKHACVRALDILLRKEYEMRLNLRADIVLETAIMDIMCPEDDKTSTDVQRIEKLEARIKALEERRPVSDGQKPEADEAPVKKQEAKKHTPKAPSPVKEANQTPITDAGDIWQKAMDSLKKESYYIYTYAQKAAEAEASGSRLELKYYAENIIAADYMKQPSAQNEIKKTLEKLTGKMFSLSVTVVEKPKETADESGILSMFTDVEEI